MAIFCPLYSGSSGNSTYLDAGESALLIDLGVSCRAAVTALQQLGADFSKLKGILITHEHQDHIAGLAVLLYPFLPFSSEKVCGWLQLSPEWKRQQVEPGYRLPEIQVLFQRLDKKLVEEENERLERACPG